MIPISEALMVGTSIGLPATVLSARALRGVHDRRKARLAQSRLAWAAYGERYKTAVAEAERNRPAETYRIRANSSNKFVIESWRIDHYAAKRDWTANADHKGSMPGSDLGTVSSWERARGMEHREYATVEEAEAALRRELYRDSRVWGYDAEGLPIGGTANVDDATAALLDDHRRRTLQEVFDWLSAKEGKASADLGAARGDAVVGLTARVAVWRDASSGVRRMLRRAEEVAEDAAVGGA